MARVLQQRHDNTTSTHERVSSSGSGKQAIWSTLLSNVASGKRIPEKRLLILGGTQDTQRELIESLAPEQPQQSRRQDKSKARKTPIANRFALGYTYKDIYDADGEDLLSRLSIYTLPDPSPTYTPLLTRLLTPQSAPNVAAAILLDWAQPWTFVAQLRRWIQLLRSTTSSLPVETAHVLEENNARWQHDRDSLGNAENAQLPPEERTSLPLGQGEFDEPIGIPLMVVVQNAQEVEKLEKERGYKETDFDFALQFLRTVLLKHGAGLIYTMPGQPGQVRELVLRTMLDVGGTEAFTGLGSTAGGRVGATVKHNVVDRERVIVPPGWDSWGKIRVLREGFDIEGVSRAWSVDVQGQADELVSDEHAAGASNTADHDAGQKQSDNQSTEGLYAARISDPKPKDNVIPKVEVELTDDQIFLAAQLERLEAFRAEDEAATKQRSQTRRTGAGAEESTTSGASRPSINEQIGPVQFNMGGIQYDADEALKKIRDRTKGATQAQGTPDRARATRESTPFTPGSPPTFGEGKDIPVENLEAYFASLMKGGRGTSAQNSPRFGVGSPRVPQKSTKESGSGS